MYRKKNNPSYRPVRLLIVDRQTLFAEGLRNLLHGCDEIEAVAIATNEYEMSCQVRSIDPDVTLLDPWMGGNGPFPIVARLREMAPRTACLFLENEIHEVHVRIAIKLQASGLLTKSCRFCELREAIQNAHRGQPAYCAEIQHYVVKTSRGLRINRNVISSPLSRLTQRELEILILLARGSSVRQASDQLKMASSTVDNHKTRMMRKLGVHKVVDLATMAVREGLLT
ncbi:MAG: LuxR C-terminal-related transcriptional regulator [Thermoguttaceae bacterium]